MSFELVSTSVPRGLNPGTRGFATVAKTVGLPSPIETTCEALSSYTHVFGLESGDYGRNPVAWSHFHLNMSGRMFHLLSRVAACAADYTGRTNRLAHHLILDSAADATPSAGPAAVLATYPFLTSWDGDPRLMPGTTQTPFPAQPTLGAHAFAARAWTGVGLTPIHAARLAAAWVADPDRPTFLRFGARSQVQPQLLQLLDDALRLLRPEARWRITFSTYLYVTPPNNNCLCRAVLAGTAAEGVARRIPDAFLLDLDTGTMSGGSYASRQTSELTPVAEGLAPPAWAEPARKVRSSVAAMQPAAISTSGQRTTPMPVSTEPQRAPLGDDHGFGEGATRPRTGRRVERRVSSNRARYPVRRAAVVAILLVFSMFPTLVVRLSSSRPPVGEGLRTDREVRQPNLAVVHDGTAGSTGAIRPAEAIVGPPNAMLHAATPSQAHPRDAMPPQHAPVPLELAGPDQTTTAVPTAAEDGPTTAEVLPIRLVWPLSAGALSGISHTNIRSVVLASGAKVTVDWRQNTRFGGTGEKGAWIGTSGRREILVYNPNATWSIKGTALFEVIGTNWLVIANEEPFEVDGGFRDRDEVVASHPSNLWPVVQAALAEKDAFIAPDGFGEKWRFRGSAVQKDGTLLLRVDNGASKCAPLAHDLRIGLDQIEQSLSAVGARAALTNAVAFLHMCAVWNEQTPDTVRAYASELRDGLAVCLNQEFAECLARIERLRGQNGGHDALARNAEEQWKAKLDRFIRPGPSVMANDGKGAVDDWYKQRKDVLAADIRRQIDTWRRPPAKVLRLFVGSLHAPLGCLLKINTKHR